VITRTEADGIAIARQRAIAEIEPEIVENWGNYTDLEKANYLAAAIVECHVQAACMPELKEGIEWEIAELSKAHEFFRVACGRSPVVGQLALEVTG
jgi:hypothetical protein